MRAVRKSEWEVRDLGDGRVALYRHGLFVKSFSSREELSDWTAAAYPLASKTIDLNQAIRKL